jgi:hypothetical protein
MSIRVVWASLARLIDYSFGKLESYVSTIQSALNRERDHFTSWLNSKLAGLGDDDANVRAELYAEDFEQLSTTFPEIARRSAFLMIYSTFENWLLVLCWRIQKIEKQAFGPQDLKGEFSGAESYLLRLACVKMRKTQGWEKIDVLRKIRNMLVHQGGSVRQGDTKFRDLVNRTIGVALDNQDMVTLTAEFCLDSIETARAYLSNLVNELRAVYHD